MSHLYVYIIDGRRIFPVFILRTKLSFFIIAEDTGTRLFPEIARSIDNSPFTLIKVAEVFGIRRRHFFNK